MTTHSQNVDRHHRSGVCVVDGYGLHIGVDRRHLIVRDGIGRDRHERRFARVGHGLNRLVVLGHSGTITLEALRWLDRVQVAFIHIDHDGKLITSCANPGLDDARLRRAQALAAETDTGLSIIVDLLDTKLAGQAGVARNQLGAPNTGAQIEGLRSALHVARNADEAREVEAKAAATYFAAWTDRVSFQWARKDVPYLPDHWLRFSGRRSPLARGSAIRAADPINATMNYLFALAEAECRLACLTIGLDPGLGFLHMDAKGRDSLTLDFIEVVRPDIESCVLDLAHHHIFRQSDFAERDDGHCRILAPLTHLLAHTMPRWSATLAPWVESVAHRLADASGRSIPKRTPLSSAQRRRAAHVGSQSRRKPGAAVSANKRRAVQISLMPACLDCGAQLEHHQRRYCSVCWPTRRRDAALAGSVRAREEINSATNRATRGRTIADGRKTSRDNHARALGYSPTFWDEELGARVRAISPTDLAAATGLSYSHASKIHRGIQIPHPRHWPALVRLVGPRRGRLPRDVDQTRTPSK